ncbi:hypothetical protein [Clostridium beijerinckii]|uniref:hypothetical protein n=1 Tax=Clostridium beijerinckii TaxID=1520 RepID=UPI00080A0324|nr:hypothetical protein [Clostridium beijerinckii]OCB00323.1 hypothetical protein BGS1_12260 [Clostridium beijerinckii]
MNKFDKAINQKASELITKNLLGKEVTEEEFRKFKIIARAIVREEMRGVKPNKNPKSLYGKTWKVARKYSDVKK